MDPKLMIPSYFGGYGPPARFRQRNNAVDAKNYDFRAQRTQLTQPNSVAESIIHLLMSCLGGNIVGFHAAYCETGIWAGLGFHLLYAAAVGYCTCSLVWSAQKLYGRVQMATLTYPDLMEACVLLSPWPKFRKSARCWRYFVEFELLVRLYGWCCVSVIVIARNLKEMVEGDTKHGDDGDPPLSTYILSLIAPCMVISMVTNLKVLAPFAFMCNMYAFGIILLTLWYGLRTEIQPWDRSGIKCVGDVFQGISLFTFLMETVTYALPVENNMDEPKKFPFVVLGATIIYGVLSMTVGFIGYWKYGEDSLVPLTAHFPFGAFPLMMKVWLNLTLYVLYAVTFHLAFDIEWFYLKRNHVVPNYWFWERLYRSLHVFVIIAIVYFLRMGMRLMALIGSFGTVALLFIYPPLIELIVDWEYPGLGRFKWRLIRYIAFVIFGLTTLFGTAVFSVCGLLRLKCS